jgi:hypothetical protein
MGLSGLLVFLRVRVAGLHSESECHLGSKIPILVVPELDLPHATAQLNSCWCWKRTKTHFRIYVLSKLN